VKLTQTQKNILIRMGRGEVLCDDRLRSKLYMSGQPRNVRETTLIALLVLELVEQAGEEERRIRTYRISGKGREAIQ
jgi:hypothetical protein